MSADITRRGILKAAGALGLLGLSGGSRGEAAPVARAGRQRVLRVAHLTDLHIEPERRAGEGVAACLDHVCALGDRPDLILIGGDMVMDSFESTYERTKTQWDLFKGVFKDHCRIPVRYCLGNHDFWGWNKSKSKTTGQEPGWGKKWACEVLGLERTYYSFEQAGWRFIVLDSVMPEGGGYIGKLDDLQREWLAAELKSGPKRPTLILSHIPVLGLCATIERSSKEERAWITPWGLMHADGADLHKEFCGAGCVKLCLSGHIHRHDRIEMNQPGEPSDSPGVTYICDGAVSGSWWQGRKDRCDEGYGVTDLFDDGSFEHHYETFGWKAKG